MTVIIRCVAVPGFYSHGPIGQYLAAYDLDARDGHGSETWTSEPARALHFADALAALAAWKSVSPTHPVRASDGKPNRPLTAYTIELVKVPD